MNWAYMNHGILHIVDQLSIAVQYAEGEVVETDTPCKNGYPMFGDDVIIYEDGKSFVHGNEKNGQQISTPDFIQALVNQIQQGL